MNDMACLKTEDMKFECYEKGHKMPSNCIRHSHQIKDEKKIAHYITLKEKIVVAR